MGVETTEAKVEISKIKLIKGGKTNTIFSFVQTKKMNKKGFIYKNKTLNEFTNSKSKPINFQPPKLPRVRAENIFDKCCL